ncbi:MAG: hypothetical protein WBB34_04035 [Xanthobacteraceae bacterium]
MANKQGGNNPGPPSQAPIVSPWARCVAKIKRKLQERRAEKKKQGAADRAAHSTARATWAIAFFTLVTIAVGASQYVTFNRQLGVMQGQLDAMNAERRPWVFATNISISRPVVHDGEGLHISLKFDLRNGGHSPAVQTAVKFNTRIGSLNFLDEEKIVCAGQPGLGNTIFPDSPATQEVSDLLSESQTAAAAATGIKYMVPIIVSCISYRFPDREGRGYTPYEMTIGPVVGSTKWPCCSFPFGEKLIEPSDLQLTLLPIAIAH